MIPKNPVPRTGTTYIKEIPIPNVECVNKEMSIANKRQSKNNGHMLKTIAT